MSEPLWRPSAERIARSNMSRFIKVVAERSGSPIGDFDALYRWSIADPEAFWREVWRFCGVIGDGPGEVVLEGGDRMPEARWFGQARLNFAENLMRRRDDATAIVFRGEDKVGRRLSFGELYRKVGALAGALAGLGVGRGDRVAGFMPNLPETVAAMLAATSLGAIWTSCSPDFGVRAALDRFGQVAPKVLFGADGYYYNGKWIDSLERLDAIAGELGGLERLIVVPYGGERAQAALPRRAIDLEAALAAGGSRDPEFVRLPFDHPVYILYSSGTTGAPKCIVHGAGGTLLQHLKEHMLHTDIRPGDRVFYFTTCGWMMWNWLVSALAAGAAIVLYDGAPFYPHPGALFDFAQAEDVTMFGTSAKYIDALRKEGLRPAESHDLSALRTICSTGSPLMPESFDYVYQCVKRDVCLSSISGGTDIVSCFVLGNPIGPVWRGEIQARGLGMKVQVFDDRGRSVVGQRGELVCAAPFPSMPIGFWNDPDGSRYRAAYFERYPGAWCHGDWAELTEHGGMIIYGRSDAVLNPGGVRIGTAEIYRQVERLDEVVEALAVGQAWDGDVRIVLFVRLREGLVLGPALAARIKDEIRRNASPRHVPARIVQVSDLPRTRSGKIAELAVRAVLHGQPVTNTEALANPEALEQYKSRPELAS